MAPVLRGPSGPFNLALRPEAMRGHLMTDTVRAICAIVAALVGCSQANAENRALKPQSAEDVDLSPPTVDSALRPNARPTMQDVVSLTPQRDRAAAPAMTFTKSRDGAMTGTSLDGRVKLRLSSASGAAMFKAGQHVIAGMLSPSVSWRNEADLTVSMPLGGDGALAVTAGTLTLRMPSLAGASRGLGEPTRWMENKVVDMGMKLDLFGERLSYSGGLSWSDYRMIRTTRFNAPNDPLQSAPRADGGSAYWQRADAKLPLSGGSGVSAYVEVGQQSANYRSMRWSSLSPLLFDGRTFETGGEVHYGRLNLTLTHSTVAATIGNTAETVATLDFHGVRIRHTLRQSDYALQLPGGEYYRSASQQSSTSLRLTPASLLASSAHAKWLPDTLTIRANQTAGVSDGRQSRRATLGVSADWNGNDSRTSVELTRAVRSQHAIAAPPASSTELGINLNHSRTLGLLEISAYGSIALERSTASGSSSDSGSASSWYGGGFAVSTSGADLPKLSLSIDYDRLDRRDQLDISLADRGLSLSASADLALLLRRLRMPNVAYLKLKGYGDWHRYRFSPLPVQRQIEPGVMLMFGMPF